MTFSNLFCERLKAERKRLKLTQEIAASMCGVARETWGRYESGALAPGAEVLAEFAKHQADVAYVLTGLRSENVATTSHEASVLQCYRMLSDREKLGVVRLLTTMSGAAEMSSDEIARKLSSTDSSK